jgi:hypothetical protein
VEKPWKTHPQEPLAVAFSFWVDPVTFSPSPDRPKMGLPLGTLTCYLRHGVHRGASFKLGCLRRAWILAERVLRGK